MDWRSLLRSRWTWVAAAVGGGVGLFVFLRRRSGGSSGLTSDAPGYGPSGFGYFDSTATDFAQQLGQYQAGVQNMLSEFYGRVEERLAQIPTGSGGPGLPPPPSPYDRPAPPSSSTKPRVPARNVPKSAV